MTRAANGSYPTDASAHDAVGPPTRLVLFPGLGADARLFEPQRNGLPGVRVEVPQWLVPERAEETLESYAKRMAALVQPVCGEQLFVGGVSFGALVALEAARHLPDVRGVFMIGGCRDPRAIAPFFRFACRAAPLIPTPLFKLVLYGSPAALVLFESLDWDHMRLYSRMLNESSPRQVQWAAGALHRYRSAGDPPGVPVYLIHGQRDLLIPMKNVNPDYVVPHGRHLVGLTRADKVNRYLMMKMNLIPLGQESNLPREM